MIKNILFDFDGTLVDSAPGIVKTMGETFKRMNIAVPSEADMRSTIGLPLTQALQQLGALNNEDAKRATDIYRELFPIYEVGYGKVFDGVVDTLAELKSQGMRMAIVTSRDTMSLDLIADKRGLSQFFETRVTGADGFTPKPAPDMVLALLERMGISADETLVVGDTTFDIEMGNSAGCLTCAVTYGNHDEETLRRVHPSFVIHDFKLLRDVCQSSFSLQTFIEEEIIPQYASFDKAHQEDHVRQVIEQSLNLAPHYEVNVDMVYAIAAYHDLGLSEDRKTHHLVSGRIVRSDVRLRRWFTPDQIEQMAQAVEDHRASSEHEPRSIYGKIVAEADRLIDDETILRRTIQYGLKHYPELDRDGQIERALDHLDEKYAEGGYLKLWIPESPNAQRLRDLQQLIKDRVEIRRLVEAIFDKETENARSGSTH